MKKMLGTLIVPAMVAASGRASAADGAREVTVQSVNGGSDERGRLASRPHGDGASGDEPSGMASFSVEICWVDRKAARPGAD